VERPPFAQRCAAISYDDPGGAADGNIRRTGQKSQVVNVHALEYLGFKFKGIRVYWSDQAFADFKHQLKGLTSRSWGVSMEYRLMKQHQYLRGWMGYFGISQYYHPIPELDGWLRRRIRMCYWKQWRRPRTRIQKLLELGTDKRHAIRTGISRKGYWHLSKRAAGLDAGNANRDDQ
jgi:RNA-directed DNA polymerase